MLYFYIFSAFFLFFSCTNQADKNKENLNTTDFKDNFTLVYKRSVKLALDTLTSNTTTSYQHLYLDGKNYYAHLNESTNSIYVFDYDSQKLDRIIPISKKEKKRVSHSRGFHIHNFDSIFIPSIVNQSMFLINQQGDVLTHYPYNNKEPIDKKKMIDMIFFFTFYKKYLIDSKFYCIADKGARAILDLKTGRWEYQKEIPKKFDTGTWVGSFYLYTHQTYNSDEKKFYYSFAITDDIYTNPSDEESKIYAGSKFFNDNSIKSFKKGMKNIPFEQGKKAFLTSNSYANIFYDKYRKMYYRIANLGITEENLKSEEDNKRTLKPFTIIILDNNKKKVGEVRLPDYEYAEDIMITKEGLHIFNHKKNAKDEDNIHFDVFELVEKNK